jgi:hypothetical protein
MSVKHDQECCCIRCEIERCDPPIVAESYRRKTGRNHLRSIHKLGRTWIAVTEWVPYGSGDPEAGMMGLDTWNKLCEEPQP